MPVKWSALMLRPWIESEPEGHETDWCKDVGPFRICGRGPYPKTFLLCGQAPKGDTFLTRSLADRRPPVNTGARQW
jgi:hypothetical protein